MRLASNRPYRSRSILSGYLAEQGCSPGWVSRVSSSVHASWQGWWPSSYEGLWNPTHSSPAWLSNNTQGDIQIHFTLRFGTLLVNVFSVRLNYKFGSESEDSLSKYIYRNEKFLKLCFGPQAVWGAVAAQCIYIYKSVYIYTRTYKSPSYNYVTQ